MPQASRALLGMLDASRGEVLAPIRSEIFGAQRFAQHGHSLGETHRARTPGYGAATFSPRLIDNIRTLRESHAFIAEKTSMGNDLSPAAEWLLDNFHLIEAQLHEVQAGLPRSYFRHLPVLVDEPLATLPRVYGIAWAFVAHTDSAFDENLLARYLVAYQESRVLKLNELWALPTTLRVVLIENLRRLGERLAANLAARELANLCCANFEHYSVDALNHLLESVTQRGCQLAFLAQIAQSVHGRHGNFDWIQKNIGDVLALQTHLRADQVADNLSVSNAVISLRAVGDADWEDIISASSALVQRMCSSALFKTESPQTRATTLHGIEKLARRIGVDELIVANTLLQQMQQEGGDGLPSTAQHWLQGAGRASLLKALGLRPGVAVRWLALKSRATLIAYLGVLTLLPISWVLWLTPWQWSVGVVMAWFCTYEAMSALVNRLITESVRPHPLPRLTFSEGIPREHQVMIVIPCMLTSAAATRELVHRLQLHYLANKETHAQFALLSDWADAPTQTLTGDAALLQIAVDGISALNATYPVANTMPDAAPRFLLLHRERNYCTTERRWIGWERKRGKLEQLVVALAQNSRGAFIDLGDISRIAPRTAYIMTLDSDTRMPPGCLRRMVSIAAHPCNVPRWSGKGRTPSSGYGILQPRLDAPLPTPEQFTPFHWLFAGQCGVDTYSAASSEVFQDLFEEGSFTGKGLLHVQALYALLANRLPEGRILSHDLLEGSMVRCAVVSDVPLLEAAPFHADVAAARVHRWTRGDWQLLPLLLDVRRYRLSALNRWKMLDNLRRSLLAPSALALLILSFAGMALAPLVALSLVFLAYTAGPLIGVLAGLMPWRTDASLAYFYRKAAMEWVRVLCGGIWHMALLLHDALQTADAVGRALFRMVISHRNLLQWTTAAAVEANAKSGFVAVVLGHRLLPVASALFLLLLWQSQITHLFLATLFCGLWGTAAVWIWWFSRARPASGANYLPTEDRQYLERLARDTWGYFERCVGPEDNHLPPDNLQTSPEDMVAHRTSPTNIGLYLLSLACAREFGWIGTADLLTRMQSTLATLSRMQRYRGHFLNWYDTQSCAPLAPLYVSTVDSGNFSGHLLAVAQACRELAMEAEPADSGERASLLSLASRLEGIAWEADFKFLYHPKRHLLHIGYRLEEQQLDAGLYDLLASESRLTSLLAIAKGDVPAQHWSALGRPFFACGGFAGLQSWSGSIFEYLMPALVLEEPHGSVLRNASLAAIGEQVAYAVQQEVPWGISESAHAGRDHTLAYQYGPHGVPRLALRRTPQDELVVAPYATALAAQVQPQAAMDNYAALSLLPARALFGMIESLDFSPSRQLGDAPCTAVETYMAHHQGMTIVALSNVLRDGIARRWCMANPHIEAVSSLLHEREPREVHALYAPPPVASGNHLQRRRVHRFLSTLVPAELALAPTHILSNGNYAVTLRSNGAGWSRWRKTGITRWRDDALRDAYGSFVYLRMQGMARPVSVTQHPAPSASADYRCTFHSDRVCFEADWPQLQVQTTVWVSPEDDVEFRQVALRNSGTLPIDCEMMSAFEVSLSDALADEAHPAFTNLFVQASWQPLNQALLFARTPRLASENRLHLAHFLTESDTPIDQVRCQTDRQHWLGRNHDPGNPLASFDEEPNAAVTGLDPVAALSVKLHVGAGASIVLTFVTALAADAQTLQAVVDKYRQKVHVQRASLMSATLTAIRLRALRISPGTFAATQSLTTPLLLTLARPLASVPTNVKQDGVAFGPQLLWRVGISGDRPVVLVHVASQSDLGILRALSQALSLWSWSGIACDLVVLNDEPASYLMPLQLELDILREQHLTESRQSGELASTGLFVLHQRDLSTNEMMSLRSLARIELYADGRPLWQHVQNWVAQHERDLSERQGRPATALARAPTLSKPAAATHGTFDAKSGGFLFPASAGERPHRPWINVMANSQFGTHVSEAGGGYTWAVNSRLNQITGWSNDPVADPPCEWFVLQDRRTLETWSLTPDAWAARDARYRVVHGQGYSAIAHQYADLDVTVTWCVDADSAIKQVSISVKNTGRTARSLRIVAVAEWVMGGRRDARRTVRNTAFMKPAATGMVTALMCTQVVSPSGFAQGTAFFSTLHAIDTVVDWTCDRRECFDVAGQPVVPARYGKTQGEGLDPCAALSVPLEIATGAVQQSVFLLGYAPNIDAAADLLQSATLCSASQRLAIAQAGWNRLLGTMTVRTPDALFDALVNRWLLYQTVSCRMWAKAGFYQAGGATGFRDQLQDAMALGWAAPDLLRQQIRLCASRQFVQGDVQHWWHAPQGAGIRSRFSDDLLWLAFATSHYVRITGNTDIWDETLAFIDGPPIEEGREDAYFVPAVSDEYATVYEHAARAIDHSLRVGSHGLPLMGTGDWNDGMNCVGKEGAGESVWLGWFLCAVVKDFVPLARAREEGARADRWENASAGWRAALSASAWDGQWYIRAFFDDGHALGSHNNPEARIDLIAQAWAVLSKAAPLNQQTQALEAVQKHLVDTRNGLIKLLDPPLQHSEPSAGYIQAYPPGVRENGGQYSHAGVWALMAQAQLDRPLGDLVYQLFTYLSPAHRSEHTDWGPVYGLEPYVMAGDVYSREPYAGRGGWSWYTGAAAWMHRAAIESIFGLALSADSLIFRPCLPSHWPHAELTLMREDRSMQFILVRATVAQALHAAQDLTEGREAQLLMPESILMWRLLPPKSCFVIPL